MSDAITQRANGLNEMAYVGDTPWHGKGQLLAAGQPIEVWLKAAGMEWKVNRSRVRYAVARDGSDNARQLRIVDDKHVLFRSDNHDYLGLVSPSFKIVQPKEVLEFFRDLIKGEGFTLNTAGTLYGGKKFWALARVEGNAPIMNRQDVVGGYLLFATGCDGQTPTTASFCATRVVCKNTMEIALGEKNARRVTIKHSTRVDAAAIHRALGVGHEQFAAYIATMKRLAQKPMPAAAVVSHTALLIDPTLSQRTVGTSDFAAAMTAVEATKGFQTIKALFEGAGKGSNLPGVKGTQWGFLNAVTEYVDHHIRARSDDHRLDSAMFGKGNDLKNRALELLTLDD